MTSEHDRYREWAGAYVLGALDPAERSEFSAHLRGCDVCRDDVADLAPLPALLATVPMSELADLAEPERAGVGHGVDGGASQPQRLEALLAAASHERRSSRRRLQRWRAATSVAAALALAAVVALGLVLGTGTREVAPGGAPADEELITFTVVQSQASEAAVDVAPRRWGTEVYLRLDGLPERDVYVVSVTGPDGTRHQIGTWGRTPSSGARITAATAIPASGLRSVMVTSADDDDVIVASRP